MRPARGMTALVVAFALGVGGMTVAPARANSLTSTVDVRFSCDVTTDATGFVANQANGVQEHDAFHFRMKVEAPAVVEPGQEFDYVLKPGFVGLPNPLATKSAAVTLNAMEQARLSLVLPAGTEVTSIDLEGAAPGLIAERSGDTLSIHGGSTTDDMDSRNPATIRKKTTKGLTGVSRGGRMGFDLPDVRLKMRAGQVGSIRPAFPQVLNPAEHHYPAADSFFTMLGDASALFFNPLALVRCTPAGFEGLPAVQVIDPGAVGGNTAEITMSAQPPVGRLGEVATVRLLATDTAGKPVPGDPMVVTVDGERRLYVTGLNGQVAVPVRRDEPGEVTITAQVGAVSREFSYAFSANPNAVATEVQVPMVCRVSPDKRDENPQKVQVVSTHIAGLHGQVPGAKVDPGFALAMTVTAPRQARVGENIDYELRPVVFGSGRAHDRTHFLQVVYEGFDHARLKVGLPGGAQLVSATAEGGQAATIGEALMVFDQVNADGVDLADEAAIGALAPAGVASTTDGERISVTFPPVTLQLAAGQPGQVAPTLPAAQEARTLTQEGAAITFAGTVAVAGTDRPELNRSVRAIFSCTPTKQVALPAVQVLPAVAGVTLSGPAQLQVGDSATVVATVRDAAGQPAADVRVELSGGGQQVVARTDENGQASITVEAALAGTLSVSAQAEGHGATHDIEVSAPETPPVETPPWWRLIADAIPGGWITLIAAAVGALALIIGAVNAAQRGGLVPRSS